LGGTRPVRMKFDLGGMLRNLSFLPGRKSLRLDNIYLAGGIQDWNITNMNGKRNDGLKIYRYVISFREP